MASATDVIEIPVAGMTCDHCVGAVRRALEGVPGVRSAAVDLGLGRAEVTLDPARTDRARLKTAVEAAGYSVPDAPPPPPRLASPVPTPAPDPTTAAESWDLAIGGMHCASCVGRVEGALAGVPGVREARVNLATERATVVVDPAEVDESRLASAVASAGYSARRSEIDPADGAEALRRERAAQVASWRNRLIAGVILTVPLVVLGTVPVDRVFGLRTPAGWIMLPLAAALQVYLGGPYLRGAWLRLKQGSSNMDTLIALGTTTAFGYGLYHLVADSRHGALMSVAGVVIFVAVTVVGAVFFGNGPGQRRRRAGDAA